MRSFESMSLPVDATAVAPDGSHVRELLRLTGGSMAHFSLSAGAVSGAVTHRTVEEIWYIVGGSGQMWRRLGPTEATIELTVGTALTIPRGTHFQFRAGDHGLQAIAITMPPWTGGNEAVFVDGPWPSPESKG